MDSNIRKVLFLALVFIGAIIWYVIEVIRYAINGNWGAVIGYTLVPAALIIIYILNKDDIDQMF